MVNWHRVVYGVLIAIEAVCTAVLAGAVVVPPALHDVAPYAGLVVVFLTAFMPEIQKDLSLTSAAIRKSLAH